MACCQAVSPGFHDYKPDQALGIFIPSMASPKGGCWAAEPPRPRGCTWSPASLGELAGVLDQELSDEALFVLDS